MKCLVIVESPSKCKIISGYLNNIPELVALYGTFTVVASCGHIRDLKKNDLSIDIQNGFVPTYEVLSDAFKKKLVGSLKTQISEYAKNKDMILLATDSDAEGSAISWHICDYFKLKQGSYKRIIFNEITKNALKYAVLHAGEINMSDVDAQETRRILDRIVGYILSPLLWTQFNRNKLSAGRVQSAALKIIMDRCDTIDSHIYTHYWKTNGVFKPVHGNVNSAIDALDATHMQTWESHEDAVQQITKNRAHVLAQISWNAVFKSSQRKKLPPPPLITSTLQQECFKRFKMNSKSAMLIAQQLYEAGHITYMRTDSTQISADAQNSICSYISNTYGTENVCSRNYVTKNSSAQEAHEAIRPTHITRTVISDTNGDLHGTHQKVYELIWKYTIASQMIHAVYTDVTYTISPQPENYLYLQKECQNHIYTGKTSILMKLGFMSVLMPETQANPEALRSWEACLQASVLEVKMQSFLISGDVHKPPSYFNEASFVKSLEKEGIGRPSTYSAVVTKLYDKEYIVKGTQKTQDIDLLNISWNAHDAINLHTKKNNITLNIQDNNDMVITSIGKDIILYISTVTPYLIDVTFTKLMETDLDKIASRESSKLKVLTDFYTIFNASINKAKQIQTSRPTSEVPAKKQSKLDAPLKDFPEVHCSIVDTKYGPALYQRPTKKFYSITPLLEWRNVPVTDANIHDVRFVLQLPLQISTSNDMKVYNIEKCYICLGRYGLYLQIDGKNIGLHPDLWQKAYLNTLTYEETVAKPAPVPVKKTYNTTVSNSSTKKPSSTKYKKKV